MASSVAKISLEKLVERRRYLHAHPELSFEENETQAYILRELAAMGIEGRKIARTGVICRLGPATGPAIALRADMDGLPVQEENDVPYKSTRANVMHACGHDGHMSVLLQVAQLALHMPLTKKGLVLLFQPAEEGLHGARLMVEEGCMQDVDFIYGIHLWNTLPSGVVGLSRGPVMANSDRFEVSLLGRGGHGSMPHDTADPIVAASSLVMQTQHIVSRNIDPCRAAVVSFGGIQSSSSVPNVIPQSVSLCGTCRCYEEDTRQLLETRLRELCHATELAHGLQKAQIQYRRGYNAVVNTEKAVSRVRSACDTLKLTCQEAPRVLSGEDFSYYGAVPNVESCFIFVGSALPDGVLRAHHCPQFDIHEPSMVVAASLFLQIVENECC